MNSKVFSSSLINQSSIYADLETHYIKKVKNLVVMLTEKQRFFLAGVVATFLIEPCTAIYAGYLMHKGLNSKKIKNLNPKFLGTDQLKLSPVLLIHGDSSNSGLFAPMIDQIVKDFPCKPIFTIDLKSDDGVVSASKHLHIIIAKVEEIKAIYPSKIPLKISFVGHSSGGDILGPLLQAMDSKEGIQAGCIIKIGSILNKDEATEVSRQPCDKVIEIVGTKDVLEGSESYLPNNLVVTSGHLGLLFNKTVINFVSKELV